MQILWADDQVSVARTLSSLVPPGAAIDFVPDGDTALSRLIESHYDLAIVDLAMPPSPWGGLWLLQQMRDNGIEVPAIVLSGEGSQKQTIEAMRLGADYVRKDDASVELAGRIADVLAKADAQRARDLLEYLPSPVAVPLRLSQVARTESERLRRLISTIESAARYRAILSFGQLAGDLSTLKLSLDQLRAPSLGTWVQLARQAANLWSSEVVMGEVIWKRVNPAVAIRNDIHHGGELSDASAADLLPIVEAAVDTLLDGLDRHRLVLPLSMTYSDGEFRARGLSVSGHSATLLPIEFSSQTPVETGIVHFLGAARKAVPLSPWILASEGSEPSTWRLYAYDSLQLSGRQAARGPEPLRYLEVWSSGRSSDCGATAADLLRRISGPGSVVEPVTWSGPG